MLLLLGCLVEPDETKMYCPQEAFEDAVIETYCREQKECGGYESEEVCVADQNWGLDCGEALYNPTLAQDCIDAIEAYGEEGCRDDIEDLFFFEFSDINNSDGKETWPGRHGCGRLYNNEEVVDELCVSPESATTTCDISE